MINQVELSWFNPQPKLVSWAKANNIILEAYSPLGSNNQVKKGLAVPEVKEVAAQFDITPAQVVLSWMHQRGVAVLPKSVHEARIKENLDSKRQSVSFVTYIAFGGLNDAPLYVNSLQASPSSV